MKKVKQVYYENFNQIILNNKIPPYGSIFLGKSTEAPRDLSAT